MNDVAIGIVVGMLAGASTAAWTMALLALAGRKTPTPEEQRLLDLRDKEE